MKSILIAEDEERIASFIAKGLTADGFTVTVVNDGITALDYALTGDFNLVILDIGLPGMSGFDVLAQLTKHAPGLPVIILTARDSASDVVAGLEGGAADYMSKPFSFAELLARIRLRIAQPPAQPEANELTVGAVRLDLNRRIAFVDDKPVELSARELTLAEVLMRNQGRVLSREQLLSRVWGYDFDPGSNIVDVYVGYLRSKLGAEHIETVRGMGYRLR